jgi:hypothetical protein
MCDYIKQENNIKIIYCLVVAVSDSMQFGNEEEKLQFNIFYCGLSGRNRARACMGLFVTFMSIVKGLYNSIKSPTVLSDFHSDCLGF